MSQSLTTAITRRHPGWRMLLAQIGIAEQEVVWSRLTPENYAAVIVSADPSNAERQALVDYMNAGGAVLDTGGLLRSLEPAAFGRARIETIFGSPGETVFAASRIVDIGTRGDIHRDAQHLGRTLYLGRFGDGVVAQLPFDPATLITDSHSRRRRFYTNSAALPDEVVAAVSKGEIRRIIERALEWLMSQRGLPWMHLWRFPGESRSLFCFRIDSDYGTRDQLAALHATARAHDIRMSWFIHVEPQQEMLALFRSFDGDELGLHAWRHRTFRSYEANAANIAEADAVLRAAGIEAKGYAAPLGRWNPGLARAIEERGFEYCSEFGLDYDDLPFHAWNVWRASAALQVPIHPISIGNFLRAKGGDDEMIAYYHSVIDEKLATGEPVILYGHPGHGRLGVIDSIFERISRERIPNLTMGEYARWWRSRLQSRFDASLEETRIVLKSDSRSAATSIRVVAPDGRTALLAHDGAYDLDALQWQAPMIPIPAPGDLRRARAFSLRLVRHAIEDFNSIIRQ